MMLRQKVVVAQLVYGASLAFEQHHDVFEHSEFDHELVGAVKGVEEAWNAAVLLVGENQLIFLRKQGVCCLQGFLR
jgi:hypothetical protein